MSKGDDEKIWNTGTSNLVIGDKITFHNTEQGVEKTYIVKSVKDNGDIELKYISNKSPIPLH